ncbi:permease [Sorangium sp. So ce854]|uniref:permease n=1 Tax=Sorangium sp. So ce854 TaxID=3133322 RepID=UPI003F610B9A
MLALAVALSLAGLAAGPLLVALGQRRALATCALDGLTLGLVPALVLSRHLPHAVEEIGAQAILWAALGYAALWLTEHRRRGAGEVLGREVAFSAIAVHALLDGAGLALAVVAADGGAHGALFAAAVLVHRLPEGLSLAARFLPAWGWRQLAARLGLLGLLTALGALLGQRLLESLPHGSLEVFIAFGLGVLLRIVVHTHEAPPRHRAARAASAVAFASGLCVALALPSPESISTHAHASDPSIAASLGALFVETAPAVLAGLAAAGLARAYLRDRLGGWPRAAAARGEPRAAAALSQAARGAALGLSLPAGPRDVAPRLRRLLLAGAPAAAAAAFAVVASELDVGSALLSLRLLGLPLTAARVAGSALLAAVVALLVAAVAGAPGAAAGAAAAPGPAAGPHAVAGPRASEPRASEPRAAAGAAATTATRLRAAVAEAVGPALDQVAAWYVVGLVLYAVLGAAIAPDAARAIGAPADVVVSALAAVAVHAGAQGATALAAAMIHKGFSVGAALAFLLSGPATNVAVLAVLKRSLGARAAAAFALSSVALAVVVGLAANALVPGASVPELHALAAHEHAAVEWVCAAALGALLLVSFTRLGPRAWFGHMGGPGGGPASAEAAPHARACDAHDPRDAIDACGAAAPPHDPRGARVEGAPVPRAGAPVPCAGAPRA